MIDQKLNVTLIVKKDEENLQSSGLNKSTLVVEREYPFCSTFPRTRRMRIACSIP